MGIRRAFRNMPTNPAELDRLFRDVTVENDGVGTPQLSDGSVTNPKLADMPGLSVKARVSETSGTPSNLEASATGQYLQRQGNVLVFDAPQTADIPADAVTQHIYALRALLPRSQPAPSLDDAQVVYMARLLRR